MSTDKMKCEYIETYMFLSLKTLVYPTCWGRFTRRASVGKGKRLRQGSDKLRFRKTETSFGSGDIVNVHRA